MTQDQWPERPSLGQDQPPPQRPRRPSRFYRTPKLFGEGLDVGYPAIEGAVLQHVSLEIGDGEIVALVGPSGAGKSTLLRALGRVLKPRHGTVYLDGRAMREWPSREVARRLALMSQDGTSSADLSVKELVWMGRKPHQKMLGLPNRHDEEAVRQAMQDTGVSALTERHLSEISGGERQRVWLAMALAQEPQVLLLDEPTAFLDLDHQMELMELLRYLNREQGMTIVMVLNDLNQAARYAQRVVMLSEGEVAVDGPPGEVLTPETIREVFGVECRVAPGTDGVEMVILPIRRI